MAKKGRKIFMGIAALFVIGGMVNACGSDGTETTSTTNTPSTDSKEPAKPAELSKEGVSSDVKIVVEGLETQNEVGDNQFSKKTAQGVFKVVKVTLTNNQKDAITIDSNSFKLIDDKGREFSYSSEGQIAIETSTNSQQESFFLKQLNPGLSITGNVVFDVPKDATGFKLQARGGFTGKKIELKVE